MHLANLSIVNLICFSLLLNGFLCHYGTLVSGQWPHGNVDISEIITAHLAPLSIDSRPPWGHLQIERDAMSTT